MKCDLDRTDMKKWIKMTKIACIGNVAPDALPGSATLVRVLDRWLNDCIVKSTAIKWGYS